MTTPHRGSAVGPAVEPDNAPGADNNHTEPPVPFGGVHPEEFKGDDAPRKVKLFRQSRNGTIQEYKKMIDEYKRSSNYKENFDDILGLDMMSLRAKLQKRDYIAVDVAYAYIERAIQIDEHLNCITEMIQGIIKTAKDQDEKAASLNDDELATKLPLYGLPFSIKSNFHVRGYAASVGLSKLLNIYKTDDCKLVVFLKDKGAIPICLTNVPQGLLAYVTSNPVYGTTKNPWDLSRTPGGSSGGEAALVAAGGVAFGIGNDLVGSLRIPAAFCGLVSLKPSQDRIPETGMHAGPADHGQLGLSSGFFTKTVEEQTFLLDHAFEKYPNQVVEDNVQTAVDIEGNRETSFNQVKKIAFFEDDKFFSAAPSNKRAVAETKEILKKKYGAEIEFTEFKWRDIGITPYDAAKMLFRNVMPDNGVAMSEMYQNEPVDQNLSFFIKSLPWKSCWLVEKLSGFLSAVIGVFSNTLGSLIGSYPNDDFRRTNEDATRRLRVRWAKYWTDNQIYAMICPSFITPAQPFSWPAYLATGTFTTGMFNLLDVPAGVVPVFPVKEDENNGFNGYFEVIPLWQERASNNSTGLPNAVQVVSLKGKERNCLELMQMIQDSTQAEAQRLQGLDPQNLYPGVMELLWKNASPSNGFESKSGVEQSKILFKPVPLRRPKSNDSTQINPREDAPPTLNRNNPDVNAPSTSSQSK